MGGISKKIILAIVVFISRLGILPPNFSPLGSFGFFGKSLPLYFITIFAFDILVGGFYGGMIFTYLGFLAYYLFGLLAKNKLGRQILFLPLASVFFFLISNFGSFLTMYPHTITGLIDCYTMALPFFQNTLFGDLAFGYGFLTVFHTIKQFYPNLLATSNKIV